MKKVGVALATAHLLLALTVPTVLAAGGSKPKPPSIKIRTNGEKTFLEVSGSNVAEVVKAFRQLQAALAEEKAAVPLAPVTHKRVLPSRAR